MASSFQNQSIIPVMPYIYKDGMLVQWNSNTTLLVNNGQCRDSQNSIDMGIGNLFPPPNQGLPVSSPITLNSAVNGVNGLDAGTIAANTMYTVFVIGDSRYNNPVASILSANATPKLPFGYDSYRVVAYWPTDGSANFIFGIYSAGYFYGQLTFVYGTPIATSVTTGSATSYTQINLANLVPSVTQALVNINYLLNANAAGDSLFLRPYLGAPTSLNTVQLTAPVNGLTALTTGYIDLPYFIFTTPQIEYKVSASSDHVAINVAGFTTLV